nr:glycosyltransferase family 2 protein [Yoonia sp. 1_MG-2023]
MHFLPAFLPYYRGLGVDRFVFIDDQSDDGSRAFLQAQNDVVVLKSGRRFGDKVPSVDVPWLPPSDNRRMQIMWRMLIQEKFACDTWALHVDVDEFLDLPDGMNVQKLVNVAEAEGVEMLWAVMIELYPERLNDLPATQKNEVIDLNADWFFDARQHIGLSGRPIPRMVYSGSRSRLLFQYDVKRRGNWLKRNIRRKMGLKPPGAHAIRKPSFLRWRKGAYMESPHAVDLIASQKVILPLRHFKFNAHMHARVNAAIKGGAYHNQSSDYKALADLFEKMSRDNGAFGCKFSRPYRGYEGFKAARIACGL